MYSMFDDVSRFHAQVLNVTPPEYPTMISEEFALERFRFLQEEVNEYLESAMKGEMVGTIDGLLDIVYIALGTLYFMGVPADQCWREIQAANMKKQRGVTSRGNKIDAVKPVGWVGPEAGIASIIEKALDK